MATAKKVTKKEEKIASVQLNPLVWEVPYNTDLIAQVIYVMRSNARQGDAHAKTRADVKGGGRKPWKQKGTGRARAGSIRSPLWRKGGVTFVPNFRNWARKINRKMRQLAVRVLLSQRLREERVEFVSLSTKSTMSEIRKQFVGLMAKGWTLVVTGSEDVARGLNNVEKIMVVKPEDINAYVLTIAKKVLVDNDAVKVIESKYTNEK